MKPTDIERESFRIIDREAGPHDFTPAQWQIVRRMIHTSADFDYLRTAHFHPQAVAAGLRALRAGKPVITDTNMARTGIRKQDARHFGVDVSCHMDDPAVHAAARSSGTTRAEAAVDAALAENTASDQAEKIRLMRLALFADLEALQQSGTVNLPE